MATVGAMMMMSTAADGSMGVGPAGCRKLAAVSSSSIRGMSSSSLSMVNGARVVHARRTRTRCMAEGKPESGAEVPASPANPAAPTSPLPVMPPSPKKPKVSTNFFDVFSFSGPAPETINGRLAMLGFVSALGVELATGEDLVSQLSLGGISWFVVTAGLFTTASLIPMFKGVSVDMKSKDIFSSTAEKWNGRFAMLGLVALAITEYVKGSPLV